MPKRRPSEKSRRLTWRLTNAVFVALFAGLAWTFSENGVLAGIFLVTAVFPLVNIFLVPRRDGKDLRD